MKQVFTYEEKRRDKKLIIYVYEVGDKIKFDKAKAKYEIEYEIKKDGEVIERDVIDSEKDVGVTLEDVKKAFESIEKTVEDIFKKNVVEYVFELNKIEEEGIKIEIVKRTGEDP